MLGIFLNNHFKHHHRDVWWETALKIPLNWFLKRKTWRDGLSTKFIYKGFMSRSVYMCVCVCVYTPLDENLTLVFFSEEDKNIFNHLEDCSNKSLWYTQQSSAPSSCPLWGMSVCHCDTITIMFFQSFRLSMISKNLATSFLPGSLVIFKLYFINILITSSSKSRFDNVFKNLHALFKKFLKLF